MHFISVWCLFFQEFLILVPFLNAPIQALSNRSFDLVSLPVKKNEQMKRFGQHFITPIILK